MTEQLQTQQLHLRHQRALLSLLAEFDRVCRVLEIPYVLFAGSLLGAVRHQGFIPWDDDLDVMMLRADYDRFLKEAGKVLDQRKFFLQAEFSAHWPMFFSKLRLNNTTCLEKFHPKDPEQHQGVYMDIFPCDNAASTEAGRRMQYLAARVVVAKCLDKRGYDTDSFAKKAFMAVCRMLPLKPFLALAKRGSGRSELVQSFLAASSAYEKNVFARSFLTRRTEGTFAGAGYPIPEDWDGLLRLLYGDYQTLPPESQRQIKQHAIVVDLEHSYEMYGHYRDGMKFDVYTRSTR